MSVSPGQYYEQLVDQIINYVSIVTCSEGTYAGPVGSTISRPTVGSNVCTVDRICPVGFDEDSSASSASISAVAAAAFLADAAPCSKYFLHEDIYYYYCCLMKDVISVKLRRDRLLITKLPFLFSGRSLSRNGRMSSAAWINSTLDRP